MTMNSPKHGTDPTLGSPALDDLLRKLASDGATLAKAELALTREELRTKMKQVIVAVLALVFGFAAILAACVVLAQSLVALVASYDFSEAQAGVIVGLGIVVATAIIGYCLKVWLGSAASRPTSFLLRWMWGETASGRAS